MSHIETDRMEATLTCLRALMVAPSVISYIDEDIVTELEDDGLFDMLELTVTDLGRNYIKVNS